MATTSSSEHDYGEGQGLRHAGSRGSAQQAAGTSAWNGVLAGSLAALVASGVIIWAGRTWGGSILPQLIAERTTAELPLDVLRRVIADLEENAKPVALIGITLGQVLAGALAGLLYARVRSTATAGRLRGFGASALLTWLVLSVIAAPLGGVGLFALDSPLGTAETQLSFVLGAVTFAAILTWLVPWPAPAAGVDPGRRSIIRVAGVGALALPALWAAGYIGRQANSLRTTFDTDEAFLEEDGAGEFELARMPAFYTPLDAFYVVSKNIVDPTVNEIDWSLDIGGLVKRPMSLSFSSILDRPAMEMASTLECISNPVGGDLISNTTWTGFPLRELLDEAGLQDGVVDIKFEAADGYTESIPLDEALQPDTLLVYLMDGQPLTDKHGYPLRLIVPNIFGMKNVKWITKIEAVAEDHQGYWQERGWSDIATVVTMSRIDLPEWGFKARPGDTVPIGGVAFAGDRGISNVEVTTDGGETWHEAGLSDVPSGRTWRLWRHDFIAGEPGVRLTAVRAIDGDGVPQNPEYRKSLPDGATGYHRGWFEVLDAEGNSVETNGLSPKQAGRRWLESKDALPEGSAIPRRRLNNSREF